MKAFLSLILGAGLSLPAVAGPHYGPALKLVRYAECEKTTQILYQLDAKSSLRSLHASGQGPGAYRQHGLARLEILQLDQLLKTFDLYTQYRQQKPIPADAMQTQECRRIEKLEIQVDGVMRTIEGPGSRKIVLSERAFE